MGAVAACEFWAPLSSPALPQLWGITLAEFTAGGYTLLHHIHHTLGHSPHKASGFGTAAVVRARDEALRLLTPYHHSPQKTKCIPQPFPHLLSLDFPPHPIKDEEFSLALLWLLMHLQTHFYCLLWQWSG